MDSRCGPELAAGGANPWAQQAPALPSTAASARMTAPSLSHPVLSADLFGAIGASVDADGGAVASERAAFDAALALVESEEGRAPPTRPSTAPEAPAPDLTDRTEDAAANANPAPVLASPVSVAPWLFVVPSERIETTAPKAVPDAALEIAPESAAEPVIQGAPTDRAAPASSPPDIAAAAPAPVPAPPVMATPADEPLKPIMAAPADAEAALPSPPADAPTQSEAPMPMSAPAASGASRPETPVRPEGRADVAVEVEVERDAPTQGPALDAAPASLQDEAPPPSPLGVANAEASPPVDGGRATVAQNPTTPQKTAAAPVPTPATDAPLAPQPLPAAPVVPADARPVVPVPAVAAQAVAAPIAPALPEADSASSPNRTEPTVGRDLLTAQASEGDVADDPGREHGRDHHDRAQAEARISISEPGKSDAAARPAAAPPALAAAPSPNAAPVLTPVAATPIPEAATPPLPAGALTLAPDATVEAAAATSQTGVPSQLSRATIDTTARIAAQIIRTLEGQASRFEMALTPESLGRVDVSLDIGADGRLNARLAFDNPAAALDLRGRVDELRRQLEDAGFTIGDDALEFAERDPASSRDGFDRGHDRAFAEAGRILARADAEAEAAAPVPSAWTSLSLTPRGVDLKV